MKGLFHLSLCLQSFSSLLFYSALVTAGGDWFSYLLPDAPNGLAVTAVVHLHLQICTHVCATHKPLCRALWVAFENPIESCCDWQISFLSLLIMRFVWWIRMTDLKLMRTHTKKSCSTHQNTPALEATLRRHAAYASYTSHVSASLSARENL